MEEKTKTKTTASVDNSAPTKRRTSKSLPTKAANDQEPKNRTHRAKRQGQPDLPALENTRGYTTAALKRRKAIVADLLRKSEVAAGILPLPSDAARRVFELKSHDQILTMPEIKWLIEGVIAERQTTLLVGPPTSGKTLIILDMAMAATSGKPWAGQNVPRPLKVVYCAAEGHGGFPARYKAAVEASGADAEAVKRFRFLEKVPQLWRVQSEANPDTFVNDLKAQLEEGETIDVVIIDTFHKASVGSEENSSTQVGEVLANVDKIAKALDCGVILLHHTVKSGGNYRGSSALEGDVDNILHVEVDGDRRWIEPRKLRDGTQWPAKCYGVRQVLDSVVIDWKEEGREAAPVYVRPPTSEERIQELLGNGGRYTREEVAQALGLPTSTVKSAVQTLIARGLVHQAKRGRAMEFWFADGRKDDEEVLEDSAPLDSSSTDPDFGFEF